MKVLLIAGIIHGATLYSRVEENITILDQYVRNDFPTLDYAIMVEPKRHDRNTVTKIIIATNFEPRGPKLVPLVAGIETTVPSK